MMQAPVTYQGGKTRIAAAVVDFIAPRRDRQFVDVCCGSGAIAIEVVRRGKPADDVVMIDKGPWGLFWSAIGAGAFDVDRFARLCYEIPKSPMQIDGFLRELAAAPCAAADVPYVYPVLQAGSFGGKAIWLDGDQWKNTTFRRYWLPTAASNRRSPVNPMMPMPSELLRRVEIIAREMRGMVGSCADVVECDLPVDSDIYIDPPYAGTTGYGHVLDLDQLTYPVGTRVFISEGRPLSPRFVQVSQGRRKGGISGARAAPNAEYVSQLAVIDTQQKEIVSCP